jgi:very-short-patch-repair endonuclease
VKRICEVCGKEFEVRESIVKKGGGKFCSTECYEEHKKSEEYRKKMSEKVKMLWQDPEYKRRQSEIKIVLCRDPEYRKKVSEMMKMLCRDPEYRKKVSEIMKMLWQDPEFRKKQIRREEKVSEIMKMLWQDPEFRKKQSKIAKVRWQDPKFREKVLSKFRDPEYREKRSKITKMLWQDPEYREKIIRQMEIVYKSSELREKNSQITKMLWQDPEFREKVLSKVKSLEHRKKVSERVKMLWRNSEYREKVVRSWLEKAGSRPNGLEKAVCELLQSYFPEEWRYVGDGKVFIAGFVPDFIHKEENWIIEVNGSYWHSLPEMQERDKKKREIYERCGYKVLEVWESEVRSDPMAVVNKVAEYFYEGRQKNRHQPVGVSYACWS